MSECTNGEMRDLLPELVSGRLGAAMRLAVEAHVAECEECAEELALLRVMRPALMRTPAIDTDRIAAAVRAQLPAMAQRGARRRAVPWSLAIAAAAVIAVTVAGYEVATRGQAVAPDIASTHAPVAPARDSAKDPIAPLPVAVPKTLAPRPAAAPPQELAVAPNASATVASANGLDNLSDLSDDDVRALTASLDGISAIPSAEPGAEIDPLGAAVDDQSAGGVR